MACSTRWGNETGEHGTAVARVSGPREACSSRFLPGGRHLNAKTKTTWARPWRSRPEARDSDFTFFKFPHHGFYRQSLNRRNENAPKTVDKNHHDRRARSAAHRTSSTSLSACMRLATCMISNWCSLMDSPSWNASNCWSALEARRERVGDTGARRGTCRFCVRRWGQANGVVPCVLVCSATTKTVHAVAPRQDPLILAL